MLAELLASPGVEETCELRSPVGFLAPHGGFLEAMTDTIAREAAERAGASLYAIRQPRGFRWHVPSNRLDPADSPALRAFVDHVEVAVAVHGWGTDALFVPRVRSTELRRDYGSSRGERPILCGGRNRELAAALASALREALPGYEVVDDLDAMPRRVRGVHPRNVVNLPAGAGVQLELPPRVRGLPPFWSGDERGPGCPDVRTLVAVLSEVAEAATP